MLVSDWTTSAIRWPSSMTKVARFTGVMNRRRTPDAVRLGHRAVDVSQQREVQQLVLREGLDGGHVVHRDPDPVGARLREAGREAPEVDRLPGTAAGPGGREEEQHHRSAQQ
jgi:hypothetical protein